MTFRKTACLATLLMSCPILCQAADATDYSSDCNKTVTIENSSISGMVYFGGSAMSMRGTNNADASDNTITVTNSTGINGIFGGFATVSDFYIGDGRPEASAKANGNRVTVTDSKVDYVPVPEVFPDTDGVFASINTICGGAASVTHSDVSVTDKDATVKGTFSANGNTVVLNGGSYTNTCIDGGTAARAWYVEESWSEEEGRVLPNVDISGLTLEAKDNRIELRNGSNGQAPDFNGTSVLVGGTAVFSVYEVVEDFFSHERQERNIRNVTGTVSGNSLNFYDVKGMKAGNIQDFQILNYEYTEMHAGDVILELTGNYLVGDDDGTMNTHSVTGQKTSIADAQVTVSVGRLYGKDNGDMQAGDKVILLKNDNGLDVTGVQTSLSIAKGDTLLEYDAAIESNETELYLINRGLRAQSGTKALAEGAAAGLALVNESANTSIEFLRDFSLSAGSVTPFVHVQASSMRHETGSSLNLSTVSLLAGLGTGFETGAGKLSAGAFFEYGKGSYTTHNSFDSRSDIDGDGNSWYMGGGILAKMEFLQTGPGHFYLEASGHMGSMHNEYDSNDLTNTSGRVASFDMDSPYYSLHGGLGYVWNMAEGHDLDIYGKYIWTRVQGTDDTLTTGDKFEYDALDSNRMRFGVRYSYNGSERFSPYVGVAYEHEFSGSCDSKVLAHSVSAPSFKGSSGMGELGLMMKPTEDLPLSINLGVQGYVGQKQGVSGNCNVMYEF